jgi:hypothetical protein
MNRVLALLLLPVLIGQDPTTKPDDTAKIRRDRLLKLYQGEAAGYVIHRDSSQKEKVELRREPVYSWTNPIRGGEQDGDVFVWTCRGRAEVIGTFFSYPLTGPRNLHHELLSLATTTLDVTRPGEANTWNPQAPGVELSKIAGAPVPARSASLRLSQIRELTRAFSASSDDHEKKHWELRLLPQPLYRYESTDPEVLDGAVFAFVTSAGTDPEIILVIEARKPAGTASEPAAWHYALGRFSDLKLSVRHDGHEVYKAEPIPPNTPEPDPKQRYHSFRDRGIPPIEGKSP